MKPSANTLASVGIGAPLAVVVAWMLKYNGIEVPTEVEVAFGAIFSAGIGYVAEILNRNKAAP